MKLNELLKIKDFKLIGKTYDLALNIKNAYTSDLLSDIMANAKPSGILITIQAHLNTVAVAKLTEQKALIICNNKPLEASFLSKAEFEKIAIFHTAKNQFEASVLVGNFLK